MQLEHPIVAQRKLHKKWDQNNDAFQDKGRTDADMNFVEEESRRANENARNGWVRSEEVMKESDKEVERTKSKWLKALQSWQPATRKFDMVTLKRT